MFSLFKREVAVKDLPTMKSRVQSFWDWYATVATRFYQTIEAGECDKLAAEVSARIDEWFPGFSWVFGPGGDSNGHSFTLSGGGDPHRQLLADFWQSQAPKIPGWTFFPARPPGKIEGHTIRVDELVFEASQFWIAPSVNGEDKKIDLIVWHPFFAKLKEQERSSVIFLFLDQALGELGTERCIGEITVGDQQLADAIPLQELLPYKEKVFAEMGWEKRDLIGFIYNLEEQHTRFLRGDVQVGRTINSCLIEEYHGAEGELSDPLAGTGADYVYVAFDVGLLPEASESEARGAVEDALEDALASEASGQVLGGAHGSQNAYIDLLLFDGSNSLEIVRRVLAEHKLPAGTSINFFAKEKRGYRIVL